MNLPGDLLETPPENIIYSEQTIEKYVDSMRNLVPVQTSNHQQNKIEKIFTIPNLAEDEKVWVKQETS